MGGDAGVINRERCALLLAATWLGIGPLAGRMDWDALMGAALICALALLVSGRGR
jgi:hypothetical protein